MCVSVVGSRVLCLCLSECGAYYMYIHIVHGWCADSVMSLSDRLARKREIVVLYTGA